MSKESGGVDAVGFQDDGKLCLNSSTEVNIIADHIIVSLPGNFNVWLASPEARFLKGKFLWSNWDVDELKAQEKEIAAGKLSIGLVGWPFAAENASWKADFNF